jgi:predicted RNA-binding protein with PIN domain
MVILVDGYNVLKLIFPGVRGCLDKQRTQFIKQLGYYKSKKQTEINDIIVVFDAGPFKHASREVKNGIVVIYSGQKSSADEWIVNYVMRNKPQKTLLITNDRKLIDQVGELNCESLGSLDFFNLVQNSILQSTVKRNNFLTNDVKNTDLRRYDESDVNWLDEDTPGIDKIALEFLMENASIQVAQKDNDLDEHKKTPQKGNSQRLSKKEKAVVKIIKKLQ